MASDEKYIIDLCDRILGETAKRQHRFDYQNKGKANGKPRKRNAKMAEGITNLSYPFEVLVSVGSNQPHRVGGWALPRIR